MIRASRVTIATLAVAGALTGGAWTLAGAAIPPESEPTTASIVSPVEHPRPDQGEQLPEVAGRPIRAQQQPAVSEVQLPPQQGEAAPSITDDPPSATSPLVDPAEPEDPGGENPDPETFTESESMPADSSSSPAPAPPVDTAAPVAVEPRTRSDAFDSTEHPAQVRDTRRNAELESGDRDD